MGPSLIPFLIPSLVPGYLQRSLPQSLAVRPAVLMLGLVSELEKVSELVLASVLNRWVVLTLARVWIRL